MRKVLISSLTALLGFLALLMIPNVYANDLRWLCSMDCPGHLIGERPCPGKSTIPTPRAIALCLHGMNGTYESFDAFEKRMKTDFNIRGVFMDSFITKYTDMSQLKERIEHKSDITGRVLFIKVSFSDNLDYVYNQTLELSSMLYELRRLFGTSIDYNLIGHSKGGLVANDYVSKNPTTHGIKRIITFGTPYTITPLHEFSEYADFLDLWMNDKTVAQFDQLSDIQQRWNNMNNHERPQVTAVASEVIASNDPFVNSVAATGHPFKDFERIILKKPFNLDYAHNRMLGTHDALEIVFDRM